MKKLSTLNVKLLTALLNLLLWSTSALQAQTNFDVLSNCMSTYIGGSSNELSTPDMFVDPNEVTYVAGVTLSNNFPLTPNAAQSTQDGYIVAKIDTAGQLLYSTRWGINYTSGAGAGFTRQKIVADAAENIYLVALTNSVSWPVTADAAQSTLGGNADFTINKFNAAGDIVFSTYWGGSANESLADVALMPDGSLLILGVSRSTDFPTTAGAAQTTFGGGTEDDFVLIKISPTGQVIFSTYLGGSRNETRPSLLVTESGDFYVVGHTNSPDYPVTPGAAQSVKGGGNNFGDDYCIAKFNTAGDILWSTFYGGANRDFETAAALAADGGIYVSGRTISVDFPTTSGVPQPTPVAPLIDPWDGTPFDDWTLTRFNPDGIVQFSTFWGGSAVENSVKLASAPSGVYLVGVTGSNLMTTPNAFQSTKSPFSALYLITRFSDTGQPIFSTYWGGNSAGASNEFDILSDQQGSLHFAGRFSTPIGLFTSVNPPSISGNTFYSKINSTGLPVLSTRWSTITNVAMNLTAAGAIHLFGANGSTLPYPTTPGVFQPFNGGGTDFVLTRLRNYAEWNNVTNTISPDSQSVCLNADIDIITGNKFQSAGRSFLPSYQWQVSTVDPDDIDFNPDTDWGDIVGGITQNYQPSVFTTPRWYRRLVLSNAPQNCSDYNDVDSFYVISASNISFVAGSSIEAAAVSAGEPIYTCPGVAVQIGGAPTATGGQAPYSYNWDFASNLNDNTISNPTATVNETTIFTVRVTDGNGCVSSSQTNVIVNLADAGEDRSYCGVDPVRIGTLPIPGEPASFQWSPTTALSCSDCPRPLASPASTTTYVLTKTITLPNNSTCATFDNVEVEVIAAPTQQLDDVVICHSSNNQVQLGYAAESGFSYTWAPGNWLERNDTSAVMFNSGFIFLDNKSPSVANPFQYLLTAKKGECVWVDTMALTMIRVDAGIDACGPRPVGVDWHPFIDATYSWTHISGPNNLLGPLDSVISFVGATTNATSVYQLEVCYEGVCCTDQVEVSDCGCTVLIETASSTGCPSLSNENDELILTASFVVDPFPGYDPADNVITWTPCNGGLDTCFGTSVRVLSTAQQTYTATLTNPNRPDLNCSDDFEVNLPAFSVPQFTAKDTTICDGAVNIGMPPVGGYLYEWTGPNSFSSTISNPTVITPGQYIVTVTDDLSTCFTRDTATVDEAFPVNAGPDQIICPGATIQLGTPAPLNQNLQYSWFPAAAPWQNGTDENSPQPQVFIASNQTFILTVTDPVTGCTRADTVDVSVDPNGPPLNFVNDTTCGNPVSIGPAALFGASYSWSPATGLSCTDCPNPSSNPASTTTYNVAIQPSGTCGTINGSVTVFVGDDSPLEVAPVEKCPVSTVNINPSLTGQCTGCTYSWSPATGLSSTSVVNPTTNSQTATNYILTVTDPLGCQRAGTVNISITPQEVLSFDPVERCPGGPAVPINPSLVGQCAGCSYSWTPASGLSNTTVINPTTTASINNYTLTVSRPDGCSARGTVTVGSLIPPIAGEVLDVCLGESVLLGSASNLATSTYSWSPAAGLDNTSIRQPTFTPTSAGNFTFNVTEVRQGFSCSVSSSVTITVSDFNVPSFLGLETLCENTCATLGPLAEENRSYNWAPATDLSCSNCASPLVCPTEDRSYVLTVTESSSGCVKQFNVDVNLTDVQPPVLFLEPAAQICSGDNILLDLQVTPEVGEYDFIWNPKTGLNNAFIQSPLLNTAFFAQDIYVYSVEVIDNESGCTGVIASSNINVIDCSILPVELLLFNAEVVGKSVELEWSTASEFNNDRFEIQRSADVRNWETIGSVAGNGTSTVLNEYDYVDENPLMGVSYYRLKQIDFDGSFEYSWIRAVEIFENPVDAKVVWYPNPARSNLIVNTNGLAVQWIMLTDALGRQVVIKDVSQLSSSTLNIDFETLPSGMYQISFIGENFMQTDKLIIQQ